MTTMYFSRSQEALLKMRLSFMTLYLYKPEVRKDVGGTENAIAGILERKYKIKDHGIQILSFQRARPMKREKSFVTVLLFLF